MAGTCQFSLGQRSGEAAWSYDGSSLVVTPEGAGPLTFAVKELAGISGDDYTVKVRVPAEASPSWCFRFWAMTVLLWRRR